MRPLLFLVAALCIAVMSNPAKAEYTFDLSAVDQEQNDRLSDVESRVAYLEGEKASTPKPKPDPIPHSFAAATVEETCQEAPPSNYYTTDELRRMIRQRYDNHFDERGRFRAIYASVGGSAFNHLLGAEHGFRSEQLAGLTHNELLVLHDLAPNHGSIISPTRPRAPARETPSTTVPELDCANGQCSLQDMQKQTGCANGQCATTPRRAVNNSPGWYPGKLLGRKR